jgi:hypothetical protein
MRAESARLKAQSKTTPLFLIDQTNNPKSTMQNQEWSVTFHLKSI